MAPYTSGVMGFVGAFGIPIALLVIAAAVVWDRRRRRTQIAEDGPADEAYKVYTREFDLELPADRIPAALKDASLDFFNGWTDLHGIRWQRSRESAADLAATQPEPDTLAARIRDEIGSASLADTVVTFLVDQSGSMRGEPMVATAVALASVEAAVRSLGARTEILGYSTAGWHGGRAGYAWRKAGGPRRPGRVCALLHIVYKSAAEPDWPESSRQAMLHPDILRENIDGEALEWASNRLPSIAADRRLLIMVSDGAPVDDLTLAANGPSYLERHLLGVITATEARSDLTLGALGIEHAVDRYYANSRAADLGNIATELASLVGATAHLAAQPARPL